MASPAPHPSPPARARRASRRARVRRGIISLHRWIGLTAGVLLAGAGLTGGTLVFREEIDVALNPQLRRVAPPPGQEPGARPRVASLQAALDAVARAYPTEPATRVRMPRDASGTYEVWLGSAPSRYVYVNPYTARVLGARRPTEFLTGWLFQLHAHALAGERGGRVVGVNGLALAALTLTGLVIWWPGRRRLRSALVVRSGAGPARVVYDLHRAAGFYASAVLLVAALTGASLVFHEAAERIANALTGTSRPPEATGTMAPAEGRARATPAVVTPRLSADVLIARAVQRQPGGTISYVYLPAPLGAGTFRVRQRLPGEMHPNGRSTVTLDAQTGRALRVEDGRQLPRGSRLYAALYPIHTGAWGGWPTRALAVAIGALPALLAVTGALVWWRRGRRAPAFGSRRRWTSLRRWRAAETAAK
ncbi:MAG: PepSY domain-containing protein [Gemmatimonadaceae bacterium]|nr:PepSY domain-containing protein [Gemmatimonadaceae bacterium]NUS32082.1 PepSY domain-containing protein [Gemmatimonadaceae bacterium]